MLYGNDIAFMDDTDSRLAQYQYNVVEPYILNLFESTSLGAETIPLDYDMLRNDKKYKTILNTHIGNRNWFEGLVVNRFLKSLQELDRRLQEEMNER